MGTILTYIIKVNIALTVFYLLYMLLFRKDTFIKLKRYYFLSVIIFSLVYPLFTLSALGNLIDLTKPIEAETAVYIGDISMVGSIVEEIEEVHTPIDWRAVTKNILLAGILLLSIRLVWQLYSILKIKSESEKKSLYGYVFYQLKNEVAPFSFFNWIFIHTESYTENELKQILLHEHTHTRQWHSLDILLVEMLRIAFWWNPIVWLMKRDITINLEYLADEAVLQEGVSSKEYQYYLLQMTNHETAVQIVNNFNVSQLKQRIIMMNTNKSSMQELAKYLFVLPLALLLITANSAYATEQTNEKQAESEVVPQPQEPQKRVSENDKVFEKVDKVPEFPGGMQAIMKFLSENIKYPVEAQKSGKQGRVIVNFIVEKDGSTSNLKVVREVDPLLDAEALRVLSLMPKWTPGELNNETVRVKFTLPIVFKLQGDEKEKTANEKNIENNEVFVVVEQQPEFPGGIEAMMKYLSDNIKYPEEAHKNNIQGRVIVNFVVNKDGSLSDVKVVRGQDALLDTEAIRVISTMPNWKPGMQRGQAVNVRYTLPIVFSLQGDKKETSTEENEEPLVGFTPSKENLSKFFEYVSENVKYPVIAQENGIMGLVKATYDVNSDGKVSNIRIIEGADPALDAELTRVIKTMPKDIALIRSGGKDASNIEISALFHLQNENTVPPPPSPTDIVVVGYGKPTK